MDQNRKYAARLENVYFLGRVGPTLRQATQDLTRDELPEDIKLALRRLERREFLQNLPPRGSKDDPAA